MTFAQPFQDYEILDRVGAGAMGTVFKARHKRLNRIVALKVLKPSLARDSRYVDRLRREARIVASLNHPYIVSGYDLGEEGGYHYFVMEFVEGKSLRGLLLEWGMFAEEYVRRVARQTAMALDHAYQRGVIHRDIKPGNILIDEAGNVKLTDMGLAKGPADLTLTRDGATVGTPQYISPEQARNPHDVDVRSDLYSLGATLYHMAAGVPPYRGDTMAELITNVLGAVPTPPNEINPALSDGLSLIIRKLLVKDLSVRYQTPQELLDDLDRIDRSEPPKVDAARLAAEASESSSWFGRVLLAMAVALLLGVAWWVGVESRTPVAAGQSKEQFLITLDAELDAMSTPGARLRRLDAIATSPVGTEAGLAQRRRTATSALDAAVNRVAEEMLGTGWAQLSAWLRDPLEWPDRARFDREQLAPRLRDRAGVALGQFPTTERMKELARAVDQALAERDAELVTRFSGFLATTLPTRVGDLLRANDFSGAHRLWDRGMATFFESVRLQPPERLPAELRRKLEEKHFLAEQAASNDLDIAEKKSEEKLLAEATAVVGLFRERLHDGAAPEQVIQTMRDYRHELETMWPAADKFRPEHNPWPEVERMLGLLQAEVTLAQSSSVAERLQRRFDFAWRTLCLGEAGDALAVLDDATATSPAETDQLGRHRRAIGAARAVEASVLAAVARSNTPPVAFPRAGSGATCELRVEPQGTRLRLVAQAIAQPSRQARLTEFRFSDLLKRLRDAGVNPLEGVAAADQPLGLCVLRLIGDDLNGLADMVQGLDAEQRAFVLDDVSPRILRVREERAEPSFDRDTMLKNLIAARVAAQAGNGSLVALERELAAFQSRVPEGERSSRENVELRTSTVWWGLAKRRADLLGELDRAAPRGAEVDVRIVGDGLEADVGMGPEVLQHDATDGWQRNESGLQYAGAGRPWSALPTCLLSARPGFEPTALHVRLQLDCVLPPATVGARSYLLQFRGVACALVIGANDGVYAALVDNDPMREENAQRAFQRALAGVLTGPPKVLAVPGAIHRLSIDVRATSGLRTRAQVRVAFEGVELFAGFWSDLSPQQAPDFLLYPQQEIAVQRIVVQALDLSSHD